MFKRCNSFSKLSLKVYGEPEDLELFIMKLNESEIAGRDQFYEVTIKLEKREDSENASLHLIDIAGCFIKGMEE